MPNLTRPQASQVSYSSTIPGFTSVDSVKDAFDTLLTKITIIKETGTINSGSTVITTGNTIVDASTVNLYLNGVRQLPSTYTVTLPTTITLSTAAEGTYSYLVEISVNVTTVNLGAGDQALLQQATNDAASAATSATQAVAARDAVLLSQGIFATTADALSKGVVGLTSLAGGTGGTNGTFALAFSGGAGSGAAGVFVVAAGAVVGYTITAFGQGYTSAPAVSFAASSGLTGASANVTIANNTDDGEFFNVPSGDSFQNLLLYKNVTGTASLITTYPSVANINVYLAQAAASASAAATSEANSLTYSNNSSTSAGQSAASATLSQGYANTSSANLASGTQVIVDALNALGSPVFFDTYADALAVINAQTLTDKQVIRVFADENYGGRQTWYRYNAPDPLSLVLDFANANYQIGSSTPSVTLKLVDPETLSSAVSSTITATSFTTVATVTKTLYFAKKLKITFSVQGTKSTAGTGDMQLLLNGAATTGIASIPFSTAGAQSTTVYLSAPLAAGTHTITAQVKSSDGTNYNVVGSLVVEESF